MSLVERTNIQCSFLEASTIASSTVYLWCIHVVSIAFLWCIFQVFLCIGDFCLVMWCLLSDVVKITIFLSQNSWGGVRRSWRYSGSAVWRFSAGSSDPDLPQGGSRGNARTRYLPNHSQILSQRFHRWGQGVFTLLLKDRLKLFVVEISDFLIGWLFPLNFSWNLSSRLDCLCSFITNWR